MNTRFWFGYSLNTHFVSDTYIITRFFKVFTYSESTILFIFLHFRGLEVVIPNTKLKLFLITLTMSLSLKQLKAIKDKYKFIVFGYIRETQIKLLLDIIPPIISYTCLAFYYRNMDEFDEEKCGENITLSEDKLTVTKSGKQGSLQEIAAFCKKWIDTNIKQIGKWTIKIHEETDTKRAVMIRLVSSDEEGLFPTPSYGFCNVGDTYTNGGYYKRDDSHSARVARRFSKGEITVILNTKDGSIKIMNDSNTTMVIYDGIQTGQGIQYKLVLIIYKDTSITLTDFELELLE